MLKKITIFVIVLLCSCVAVCGQKNATPSERPQFKHFSPEEFQKKQEAYIVSKTKITSEEAAFLFPLYHQQKNLQRKNDRKIRHLYWSVDKVAREDSAIVYLKQIRALQKENSKIELMYQKKILSGLSTQKYLKVLKADAMFEREMLHHLMQNPPKNIPNRKKKN